MIFVDEPLASLRVGKRRVPYRVRESRTALRMRIKVSPGGVEVVTPAGAEAGRAAEFLRQNSTWVLGQLDFIKRAGSVRVAAPRSRPETVVLRGKSTRVEVITEETTRRYALVAGLVDNRITIRVSKEAGAVVPAALERWLRREAKSDIEQRLTVRAKQMRQRPGRVYIMGQRTKWGGCSRRRNLTFNWRLVMAPPEVLDYIVVHELAHLAEPYHSTKFWLIVRSYCPDCERHRRWLRDNGERMMAHQQVGQKLA